MDRRNRASVVIRGNRNSVASILNARAAMRNVRLGARITGFENELINEVLSTMAQHPFDMSMADEPTGLSDAQINRLPRTKPTQSQLENSCTVNFSSKKNYLKIFTGSICMETYTPEVDLLTLPCFHVFHYDCIKPWFATKNACPVCRADVRGTG